jgi:hypothetical protein
VSHEQIRRLTGIEQIAEGMFCRFGPLKFANARLIAQPRIDGFAPGRSE